MMPMEAMKEHGLAVEFVSALLSQAGLPIPAEPAMIVAGALAMNGYWRPEAAWLTAALAALIADHAWFLAGRWRGRAMLSAICRISLSPDSCVRQADNLFVRLGPSVLVMSKMIPGVAAVAIPTAAASGMSYRKFLLYDGLGAALWSGLWVGIGMIFTREVDLAIAALERTGPWVVVVVASAIALWVVVKLLQRQRLKALYRAKRISPEEVAAMVARGHPMVILDARSELAFQDDPRMLPHSHRVPSPEGATVIARPFADRTIVSFCTCPNEASAAVIASHLIAAGFRDVRVLAGGAPAIDALYPYAL